MGENWEGFGKRTVHEHEHCHGKFDKMCSGMLPSADMMNIKMF